MDQGLKDNIVLLLSEYLADLNYWCAALTVDDVNAVTGGSEFKDEKEVEARRVLTAAILGKVMKLEVS